MSFSDDMQKIQDILDKYEEDRFSLEEALAEFEKGIALIRKCQEYLLDARQKVTVLTESGEIPLELKRQGATDGEEK